MGLPASERTTEMRVVDIYRREGDKLAENWVFIDILHYLRLLGCGCAGSLRRDAGIAAFWANVPPKLALIAPRNPSSLRASRWIRLALCPQVHPH